MKSNVLATIETKKREKIILNLFKYFDKDLFEGISMSGSMVYGKNYSIREDSDIDLMFFIKKENFYKIFKYDFFNGPFVSKIAKDKFMNGEINALWNDYYIHDIKINFGVVDFNFSKKFCCLEETEIITYKDRFINPNKIRYKEKPIVEKKGEFRRYYPYQNFLFSEIIFDKRKIIKKNLEKFFNKLRIKFKTKEIIELAKPSINKSSPQYKKIFLKKLKK